MVGMLKSRLFGANRYGGHEQDSYDIVFDRGSYGYRCAMRLGNGKDKSERILNLDKKRFQICLGFMRLRSWFIVLDTY